jgi:hypothetical protein
MGTIQAIASRIAKHMWEADGKPELVPGEPTSVNRAWYERRSLEVITALHRMGYQIRQAPPATPKDTP